MFIGVNCLVNAATGNQVESAKGTLPLTRLIKRYRWLHTRMASFETQRGTEFALSLPIRLSLSVCVLLLTGPLSLGFCPKPDPSVACEFLNSRVVFVGKVVSVRTVPPHGEELDGWTYVLNVQEWFRGPHTKTIEVFTENTSGRFLWTSARHTCSSPIR